MDIDCCTAIAGKPAPTGVMCWAQILGTYTSNCGSGLARDDGGTFNMDVDCCTAFAGKPAPTGVMCWAQILGTYTSNCGSGLARDGGGTFNMDVDCCTAIAGKPAPTGVMCWAQILGTYTSNCVGQLAAKPFPARSRLRHNHAGNTSGSRLSIRFFNASPSSVSPSITRRRRKNSVSGSS
ncbi:hypothetical protein PS903_03964 [Pseudomonas fluorescens]|nr:hypothetical protein PS903_03964 [Pseudomonas fluorescens]